MIRNYRTWGAAILGVAIALSLSASAFSQGITVRTERWLGVRQASGNVTLIRGADTRAAQAGDRLEAVGDGLKTAAAAKATLEVDTGVGFIDISENTEIRIQTLAVAPDNGRITHLSVPYGQARLRVRRFTHEGSELEIRTPAGVAGVRGTEFGVSVQADGKMGLATLEGAVETAAQGQPVMVPGGYQNLIVPGSPPTQPVPLQDNPELEYRLGYFFEGPTRYVRLMGQVDPVNTVFMNGNPLLVDRTGRFEAAFPAVSRLGVEVTVVTPLGNRKVHALTLL